MLIDGVVLLHENARLHAATRTRALLKHFSWELFYHPVESQFIAPNDYHLKNLFQSQLMNNKEILEGIKSG
jgi:hypothetical protein